jgi:ATP-binding protein involved in chromosome partitioning
VVNDDPTMARASPRLTEEKVMDLLAGVVDPELGMNIVDLGMVRKVAVSPERVEVEVALTIEGCPLRHQIRKDIESKLKGEAIDAHVEVRFTSLTAEERSDLMRKVRARAQEAAPPLPIPATTPVLAIGSGKGGVGKSTVSANLAVALAWSGRKVAALDADIAGFSLPKLLGLRGRLTARRGKIVPLETAFGKGTLSVVSMGLIAEEDSAVMWRGLLLGKALEQFLYDVDWGTPDFLVIDLPPGTSDVSLGLARWVPRAQLVVVTTPPSASEIVASRIADLARKANLRVMGVVENMSYFECEHGARYRLFGEGGGQRLAERLGADLLGQIPIFADLSSRHDSGIPVASLPGHPARDAFSALADAILERIASPEQMQGCTARSFPKAGGPSASSVALRRRS